MDPEKEREFIVACILLLLFLLVAWLIHFCGWLPAHHVEARSESIRQGSVRFESTQQESPTLDFKERHLVSPYAQPENIYQWRELIKNRKLGWKSRNTFIVEATYDFNRVQWQDQRYYDSLKKSHKPMKIVELVSMNGLWQIAFKGYAYIIAGIDRITGRPVHFERYE